MGAKLTSPPPMLDTIRVAIPLTLHQHRKMKRVADARDAFQWAQVNPVSGEVRFVRLGGLADMKDGYSYHRELRWDIPQTWEKSLNCALTLEFSVPKLWYGHNVHLLYDFLSALRYLKETLDNLFQLKGKNKLPDPTEWLVKRVDICYAWRFPSQNDAKAYLNSLSKLHFPYKKPAIWPDQTIFFKGSTYSIKFYLKLPEFQEHDLKQLVKDGANYDWINEVENRARGVLRFEATLRRRFLKLHGVRDVGDLLQKHRRIIWDSDLAATEGFIPEASLLACLVNQLKMSGRYVLAEADTGSEPTPLPSEAMRLEAPPGTEVGFGGQVYTHPGGGGVLECRDKITVMIQYLLGKFIGEESGMQRASEVREKLRAHFKPVKASRLLAVWLYVQKFGTTEAKQEFGRDSFYRTKRELKQAGVSLVDMPENVTVLDTSFLSQFRLQCPSHNVTNPFDDFRTHGNVLNLDALRVNRSEA